jgi:magnesium transporter
MARTRLYRGGTLVAKDFPVAEISDHLGEPDTYVWLDYCEPTAADLARIAEELSLHPLAVEDAVNEHQRPKLDRYDTHLFLSAYAVELDSESGELRTSEIGAFITPRALVTVRKDDDVAIDSVLARWDASSELANAGVSFLLWGLLDDIVDGHFDAVQSLDAAVEELEDLLFDDVPRNTEVQRRSFEFRKSLVLLRRVVLPMREVVNSLMRRDLHVLDAAMAPYYQDVYDHVLRATEWTESLRDLVTTILETNLTIQGNRMNLVMKKVTSWAAIIAVPTAITGFYGQNVPYPGFAAHWGFWFSSALIVALSAGLYVAFRRRDWI